MMSVTQYSQQFPKLFWSSLKESNKYFDIERKESDKIAHYWNGGRKMSISFQDFLG